jgi:hypothetical protein
VRESALKPALVGQRRCVLKRPAELACLSDAGRVVLLHRRADQALNIPLQGKGESKLDVADTFWGDVGESGVSLGTVINFESGERQPIRAVMEAIRKALEDAGVEFIPENGGGLGVRFANRRKSSKK